MQAFIQYSRQFTQPITQLANIANIIQSTIASAERVFELLDESEEVPEAADAIRSSAHRAATSSSSTSISATMPDVPLIEDMNIDVKPGQTIAIVGPTGAGKTTLVNLLMRFYELNSGAILVDGVDITQLKRGELCAACSAWCCRTPGSSTAPSATTSPMAARAPPRKRSSQAAKAAHADHFIRTLPEGYDTVLNEEATNISQGQKQLLTIARAVLADPAILILDEATSSVDTRTEMLIQKAMSELMQGRTSFVIAHRLSTIRDADLILVMNHGTHHRAGHARGAAGEGRLLRRSVQQPVHKPAA